MMIAKIEYFKIRLGHKKPASYVTLYPCDRRDSDSSSSSSSDDDQMNNSLEEYFQAQVQNQNSRQNNINNQARLRPVARHRNKNWNNFNHNLQTTSTTQSGNVFTDNTATYQSLPKSYSTYRSKTNRNCSTLPNACKKTKISATNSSAKNTHTNSPNENQTEPAKPVEPPKTPEPTKPKVNFIANRIDVVARVFFPLSFLVFNFAYWYYYSRMALTDF